MPGPASTQLAIFCAYRVGGPAGAIVGGLGFIVPAVVMILALSVLFFGENPPTWVRGAGAGAGAAVPAVALSAGFALLGPSWRRSVAHARWVVYVVAGAAGAICVGAYLVLVIVACGLVELALRRRGSLRASAHVGDCVTLAHPLSAARAALLAAAGTGGFGALAWTAFKVGALSFGGGFVIVPLMQGDAVHVYHWMSNAQFLNAVALGQVTPGPVVATVAAVGYAAHGFAGGVLAALVAFVPSFAFVLSRAAASKRMREDTRARAFLDGAGPCRDRSDPRCFGDARRGASRGLAGAGARARGDRVALRASRHRRHAARRRSRGRRGRARRRADLVTALGSALVRAVPGFRRLLRAVGAGGLAGCDAVARGAAPGGSRACLGEQRGSAAPAVGGAAAVDRSARAALPVHACLGRAKEPFDLAELAIGLLKLGRARREHVEPVVVADRHLVREAAEVPRQHRDAFC